MSHASSKSQEDAPGTSRGFKIRRLTVPGLIFLAVILTGILTYDEKLQPADDLLPRRPVPKPEENGWVLLQKLWGKVPEPDAADRERWKRVILGTEPWDEELAARLAEDSETLIADAEKALALPDWQWPTVRSMEDIEANTEYKSLVFTRCSAVQAGIVIRWRSGDSIGALRDLDILDRLCSRNSAGGTTIVDTMVSMAGKTSVLQPLPWMMAQAEQPDDMTWVTMQNLFLKAPVTGEDLDEALRGEHLSSLRLVSQGLSDDAYIMSPFAEWLPQLRSLLYKENLTSNRISDFYRGSLNEWMKPVLSLKGSRWGRDYAEASKEPAGWDLVHPNVIGNYWMQQARLYLVVIEEAARRQVALFRLMALRIALHRWQLKHDGKFPETLEALTPEFIAEIPADPYDGKPLRWVPGECVYALGRDWRDDVPVFKEGWIDSEFDHPGIRLSPVPAGGSSDAE